MMVRILQEYCSNVSECSCEEIAKRYQITAKIFEHLNKQYKVVGSEREMFKNEKLLEQLYGGPKEILCEYCEELGAKCDEWQHQLLKKGLN